MDVLLFGNGKFASLAWHALTHDSPHRVVGFTVHREFNNLPEHLGLPVVDFETAEETFDVRRTRMLVSVGWQDANRLRESVSEDARNKGFAFVSYVSSRAIVAPGVEIGENSMVFDGAVIQPFASIGRGSIVRSGAVVSHHVAVGEYGFLASGATVGGGTTLGRGCFLGLGATVFDGIALADHTIVGAGAVVRRSTRPGDVHLVNARPKGAAPEDAPR